MKVNSNVLKEIVEEIIHAADEIAELENLDLVQQGELIGYAESLCIIRDALAGRDLETIGLDFDIDKRYLQ